MTQSHYDVIIIGAGPAGSATALFVHQKGYRVAVLEQSKFPRDKVCGEFISPAADDLLAELGLLDAIQQRSPVRLKGVAISAYEGPELLIDYPYHRGRAMASLSLPRFEFDHMLFEKMKERGIDVLEQYRVDDLIFTDGQVVGVKGRDAGNRNFETRSRVVVDAGGRNAVSVRRLNLKKTNRREGKIALAAHWRTETAPDPYCYMHISPPGYTGMAQVGDDALNIVLVVNADELKGKDPQSFYRETVLNNPRRARMLEGAEIRERVRTVDSLAYDIAPVPCGGLMLVGDAMGFIDPFTGEGIYLSLRSAQLVAETLDAALQRGEVSRTVLAVYETERLKEFQKKFTLSRMLQTLIYSPVLCRQVVGLLGRNPALGGKLVGVIGDYIPANRVVSFSFLARLLVANWIPESPCKPTKHLPVKDARGGAARSDTYSSP